MSASSDPVTPTANSAAHPKHCYAEEEMNSPGSYVDHDERCCMTVAGATEPHFDCPGIRMTRPAQADHHAAGYSSHGHHGRYVYRCTCGWQTTERTTYARARAAWEQHAMGRQP